ncbi:unnamed protein product [Spodoptera littoralis]|uniref:Sodium/potassium-transporting ATPase subunit beta-1-interacting protein n=1 Tax=Spodoptera littoralis TaxID=7109 RepID=A0A9P0I3N8_SPOLI|nr:unnamed protein product [Spodoptera littoralis]CAH1639611.1 unnamed protein product [Spodoptera littoralis]
MAVCGLRTLLLIVCILELIITVQRQVFDFLGYMWLPIIANFTNILLIIFGSFGAVQYITKYLLAYAIWSFMWLVWNIFLICYYLNLGTLNRDSGLLSLGTGSVSWWESNGWGCQPVWDEVDGPGTWRPTRVEGCFMQWDHVELGQSAVAATLAATALPLAVVLSFRSFKKQKPAADKGTISRRPVYTIELSPTETNISETSMKPMTPRRVKRRSGSRGNNSSVRRSRRSYRNAGYLSSNASLPRESRASRPTSAHSSYSNFHAARPVSYHAPERENFPCVDDAYNDPPPPVESVPIVTNNRYNTIGRSSMKSGYDVVGPYNEPNPQRKYESNIPSYDNIERSYDAAPTYDNRADNITPCESPSYVYGGAYGDGAWQTPPPPAPPYSARATPQAPGPPAYQAANDHYNMNVGP